MSKKNSNAILKKEFKGLKNLSEIYHKFRLKLDKVKKNSYVVAISGGPDSLALAALTKSYSLNCYKKVKFFYILIDHKIRKNSSKEANQVKNLLKKFSIDLKILVNREKIEKNIQGNARKVRYDLLRKFCDEKKIKIILTGHNLEDQVETFFIRLSRGSGLTGLSAMKTLSDLNKNIKLFRPLLDTKKKYLKQITRIAFGKFFNDPSNRNSKYLRTKIRGLKNPLEQSGINYEKIIQSISNLASSKETLDKYINEIIKQTIKNINQEISINFEKFNNFNQEIKVKLINESIKILKKNYYNPRSKKVINLIAGLEKKGFKKATLGGCIFYKKKEHLYVKIEKKY